MNLVWKTAILGCNSAIKGLMCCLPEPKIIHLKAPVGGFRTKSKLAWENDEIQPKPSPTVMLFQITHKTKQQNLSYKTILFFKYYKHQSIKIHILILLL
jgi:hypothetical protein